MCSLKISRGGTNWAAPVACTVVLVYSATKGLAAMTLAVAHSRGWLDYEERVCTYWPEFAQNGKETMKIALLGLILLLSVRSVCSCVYG
jgi:CubicO group peptidase (beta-lactamase class C family)